MKLEPILLLSVRSFFKAVMKATRRGTKRKSVAGTKDEEKTFCIPPGVDSFGIEAAWIIDGEGEDLDSEWNEVEKKNEVSERFVWWPALVERELHDSRVLKLWYTRSKDSTSIKDLDKTDEYGVILRQDGTLHHVQGNEAGKTCFWRAASWEKHLVVEHGNDEAAKKSDIDELRGNYLELQSCLERERIEREELSKSVQTLLRCVQPEWSLHGFERARMYLSQAMINCLRYKGRETGFNYGASSTSYRSTILKTRMVDCTLQEFRAIGKRVAGVESLDATFRPSYFTVCGSNMRQKDILEICFTTFTDMCQILHVPPRTINALLYQSKADLSGNPTSYQIVGAVLEEKHEQSETKTPECVILPGRSIQTLQVGGDEIEEVGTITRSRGFWHEQSATCDMAFLNKVRTKKELLEIMDEKQGRVEGLQQYSFRFEWEALKREVDVVSGTFGESSILGRIQICIPVVYLRTARVLREIAGIVAKKENNMH